MPFFGLPIRNGLPIGLGSVAGFGVQQFDPSQLFAGGTVAGAWYDPSDLTTLFTTSAGTTQCAMPGGGAAVSVGRMLDKSGNGNHAIAFNDTTARPELRARVNLLTYSEDWGNAVWQKGGMAVAATGVLDPFGGTSAFTIKATTTNSNNQTFQSNNTVPVGTSILYSLWVRRRSGTGTVRQKNPDGNSFTDITSSLTSSWQRFTLTSVPNANGFFYPGLTVETLNDEVDVYGVDLRPANIGANVPAYQRIADANTYDTSGFPLYLRFDGIDDSMYTPANLNLSGTDKVAVFAGVRKLSDAVAAVLTEFSANWSANNGSFYVAAPEDTGASGNYTSGSRGTAGASVNQAAKSATTLAPVTNVLTATHDIAGDFSALRLNGAASGTNGTADKGSGNFNTYPLYIGSRGNSSVWLNGQIYSLIIAGSAVSAGNISATEQWVAGKTGIQI